MKEKTLFMIGNAHIDPVWLWQWQEGFHEVKATFRSALDRMNEDKDFTFTASSAAFYEWVEKNDPPMFAEIQDRVEQGRWQIVGGWWIEPDCNLPCGESFARQALYGQRYFQRKFNKIARIGYNVDSFGHNGMLPQILSKSRLKFYVFMRPMPHEKDLPGRLFWWEADDGSRVLAFRLPFSYASWHADLESHIAQCAAELEPPLNETLCFYGVGDHGGGPTRANLDSIHRLNEDPRYPRLVFDQPEHWFDRVKAAGIDFPVVHDDLQHHASGCYAAHSAVKRWNRKAENLLLTAESYSAIAQWAVAQPYPPDFERAWKNVLFNQFHDILAGTSIPDAYEDVRDQLGEATSIAARALNYAVQSIAWQVKIPQEENLTPILVFNPHAWESQVNVELEINDRGSPIVIHDDAGQVTPAQRLQSQSTALWRSRLNFIANLPPLGYRTYLLHVQSPALEDTDDSTRAKMNSPIAMGEPGYWSASDTVLENERLQLVIDKKDGTIARLIDKHNDVDLFSSPAALPVVLDDPSDTWSHNVFKYDQVAGVFGAQSVRLIDHGPVKSIVRVMSVFARSNLIQDFILYRQLNQIEVHATVDWHEQFKVLKLRFPVNLRDTLVTAEIPYGHIVRSTIGEEDPCQRWVDVSGVTANSNISYGLSILNDGKYSYDVNGNDLGLTVLRSPIYAHHTPAVPNPQAAYRFIDQGVQHFNYVLLPHTGSWEQAGTVRRAAELNQPPIALIGTFHPTGNLPQSGSFLSLDRENVNISAVKKAEDNGDLIVRCYETSGIACQVTLALPFWNRTAQVNFKPCEIKTLRVPQDPAQAVVETDLLEW